MINIHVCDVNSYNFNTRTTAKTVGDVYGYKAGSTRAIAMIILISKELRA